MSNTAAQPKRRWKLWALLVVLFLALGATLCVGAAMLSSGSSGSFGHGLRSQDYGPLTLEERIMFADVIARVNLRSVRQTTELRHSLDEFGVYQSESHVVALEFTFDVLEYLKGSGSGQLKAVTYYSGIFYPAALVASTLGRDLLEGRDDRWDDREAIVLLRKVDILPSTLQADRYWMGIVDEWGNERYPVSSDHPLWLPDALNDGEQRYLLEEAPEDGEGGSADAAGSQDDSEPPLTISLSEFKTRVAELDAEVAAAIAAGPTEYGPEEYRECVRRKYEMQRRAKRMMDERGSSYFERYDVALASGAPSGIQVHLGISARYGLWSESEAPQRMYGGVWIEGRDSHLFRGVYPFRAATTRPLPAGEYRFYFAENRYPEFLCDGTPEEEKKSEEVVVTVTAPAGVVHEAFFDPAESGGEIGFSDTFGKLSPADFTIGQTDTTIESLYWESGKAKLTLEPSASLAGHSLDFIALDGTVSTTLRAADATSNGGTLTWNVASQPWSDGDLLMLRARDVGVAPDPTATPTPTPTPTATPTPTPTPMPPEAPTITSVVPGSSSNQLVVTWEWNGDSCFVTGRSSGYEVIYKKATVASWRDPSEITAQAPNDSDSGAYEVFADYGRRAISQTFTIGASASGSRSHGQIGVALDAVAYDVRVAVYSGVCNVLSPDSEVWRGTPTR